MTDRNQNKLIESIINAEIAFLITIDADGNGKTEMLCMNPEMTYEGMEERIADALMTSWALEGEQPEDEPAPLSKFAFEIDPCSDEQCDGDCETCMQQTENEIRLSEQN